MAQSKQTVRKMFWFLLSVFIMGLGIALCSRANLGIDPMSSFALGIANKTGLRLGQSNGILQVVFLVLSYFLDKKNITIGTWMAIVICSLGIDAGMAVVPPVNDHVLRVCMMVIGLFVYAAGIAWSLSAKAGASVYDCLILGIQKALHLKSYAWGRWIVDGGCLLLGLLLGVKPGICTIAILLFCGKLVEWIGRVSRERIFRDKY